MERYLQIAADSFLGYARYLGREITEPGLHSYFYGLILVSLVMWAWELLAPWRRQQSAVRRDFWLDGFYMFFNFFLFSLVGYNAASDVAVQAFRDALAAVGVEHLVAAEIDAWPVIAQLAVLFVLRDFIHYWVHRLLHRVPWLWRFHKVHHSVLEMGFAAHLRFHWMETVVYRTLEYVPLAMIGFGIQELFAVHMTALVIGHWNHANIRVPLGPLGYVVNNPQFHIWHHARDLPSRWGANYGLSLSLWDWLFGTAHQPGDGRDEELGFEGVERWQTGFWQHMALPFRREDRPRRPDRARGEA